jgi:hypothetical protein
MGKAPYMSVKETLSARSTVLERGKRAKHVPGKAPERPTIVMVVGLGGSMTLSQKGANIITL